MLPQHDDFKRRLADIVKRDSRHIERVAGHFAAELLFLQGKNLVRLRERNRAHLFIVAHDDRFLRGKKNRELRNVSLTRFVNDEAVETLLQVELASASSIGMIQTGIAFWQSGIRARIVRRASAAFLLFPVPFPSCL